MNKEMNIQEVEKILAEMPKFERSRAADELFYTKLYKAAERAEQAESVDRGNFFSWLKSPRFAFVGTFAVLLIMASGVFWAYQPSVTYGHSLYGLKRATEKVELAFAFSPLSKVDAHLNFSDRRLEEANSIMGKPSAVAFLLQTAFADEGEVDLTTEEENNLEKTLDDMKSEVDKAAEIIETRVTEPVRARLALERIEQVTDRHIETLAKLEKRVRPPRIKEMVRRISGNEDLRMAIVAEAREDVAQALEKRERNVKLILQIRRERMADVKDFIEDRRKEAGQEMQKALQHLETLPLLNQKEFQFKIETVKNAFEKGKFGQAEGLSKAMQKRMLEFKPAPLVPQESAQQLQPPEQQPKFEQQKDPATPLSLPPLPLPEPKPAQEKPGVLLPPQPQKTSQPLFFITQPQPQPQPEQQPQQSQKPQQPEQQPQPAAPGPQQLPPDQELFQILQELKRVSR